MTVKLFFAIIFDGFERLCAIDSECESVRPVWSLAEAQWKVFLCNTALASRKGFLLSKILWTGM